MPVGNPYIGILYSKPRQEEILLFAELDRCNARYKKMPLRGLMMEYEQPQNSIDMLVNRCQENFSALDAVRTYEDWGIRTINDYRTSSICFDKSATSSALAMNNVPSLRTITVYSPHRAIQAMEEIGFPVVLKTIIGSHGRGISRIENREDAEVILNNIQDLGMHHRVIYIQEYVDKIYNRDIRSFVVGDECICAIYRTSEHWITNTANGGVASNCPVTSELEEISLRAANAVGSGILAIDLVETEGGLRVIEVNHNMEFRNSINTTGVNIPEKIINYILKN